MGFDFDWVEAKISNKFEIKSALSLHCQISEKGIEDLDIILNE